MTTSAPSRPPLWTPAFVAMCVANWSISMIFWMLTSHLSTWSMASLGASQAQAGAVGGGFFAGACLSRLVTGPVLGRLGERRVILGCMVLQLALCLTYPMIATVEALIGLRFAHGLGIGVLAGTLTAAALGRVPSSRRGEGSGWFTLGLAIATGLGPWLGATLGRHGDAVFWASVGFASVSMLMGLLIAPTLDPTPSAPGSGLPSWSDMVDVRALPIGAVGMLCGMAFGLVLTFVTDFGASIGQGKAAAWYFLVYALVILVSRPVAGVIQDRVGDLTVIAPIVIAAAVGLALTAVASSGWVLLAGAAMLGLGYGTLVPAGQTVAINRVGHARAGVGLSSYFLLVDLGTGLGPVVLGSSVAWLGYRGAFWTATALACCAVLLTLLVRRRDTGPLV